MKAVILAAGYGSRLQPFTSFRPKHMLPVAGKYVLERGINYIRDVLEIDDIILVVGYLRNAIMEYFGSGSKCGVNLKYVIQHSTDKRGLAAALALVEDHIHSDFVLYLADNLFEANLKLVVENHFENSNHATLHVEKNSNPSRFGVVVIDDNYKVIRVVEKPRNPPSNLVISGFYVFSPLIFKYIKQVTPSSRGEYELTDAIQLMINDNARIYASMIEGWRQDIGRPEDLLEANQKYLSSGHGKNLGKIIDSQIVEPVYIHPNAKVVNSKIGPYVMLESSVEVINSEIKKAVILEKTKIVNSQLKEAIIGAQSKIEELNAKNIIAGDFTRINSCK